MLLVETHLIILFFLNKANIDISTFLHKLMTISFSERTVVILPYKLNANAVTIEVNNMWELH